MSFILQCGMQKWLTVSGGEAMLTCLFHVSVHVSSRQKEENHHSPHTTHKPQWITIFTCTYLPTYLVTHSNMSRSTFSSVGIPMGMSTQEQDMSVPLQPDTPMAHHKSSLWHTCCAPWSCPGTTTPPPPLWNAVVVILNDILWSITSTCCLVSVRSQAVNDFCLLRLFFSNIIHT